MEHIAACQADLRRRAMARRGWLALFCLLMAWAVTGWVWTRWPRILQPTLIDIVGDVANFCAFVGIVCFTAMLWLGTRNRWLEHAFGLDVLLLTHRRLGMITTGFLCGHAVLRSWSISMSQGMLFDVSLLYRLRLDEWDVVLGRLALGGMLLCTALAILGQKYLVLAYRQWKRPHLAFYVLYPMGLLHGLFHGDDVSRTPLWQLWAVLVALFAWDAAARWRYVLAVRPRRLWTLTSLVPEADHTATVTFEPAPGAPADPAMASRQAGQFVVLRVPGRPDLNEPHPFTLSGPAPGIVPGEEAARQGRDLPLQCTIKEAGDFTRTFLAAKPGETVLLEGPYGQFLHDVWMHERLALLAGGVGATPFLSLLRSFAVTGRAIPTVFIWSNKTRADVFAVGELAELAQSLPLTVVHCISRETQEELRHHAGRPGVHWQAGRMDAATLTQWLTGREAWHACGPEPWLDGTLRALRLAHGVHPWQVRREHFFW